jgi:hypothetical protein
MRDADEMAGKQAFGFDTDPLQTRLNQPTEIKGGCLRYNSACTECILC